MALCVSCPREAPVSCPREAPASLSLASPHEADSAVGETTGQFSPRLTLSILSKCISSLVTARIAPFMSSDRASVMKPAWIRSTLVDRSQQYRRGRELYLTITSLEKISAPLYFSSIQGICFLVFSLTSVCDHICLKV